MWANSLSIKLTIKAVQGKGLESDYAGQMVSVVGVVTSVLHRGFYLQSPNTVWDGLSSDAIFIYSPDFRPQLGVSIEVTGEVANYLAHDLAKPVTQLVYQSHERHSFDSLSLEPLEFDPTILVAQGPTLARWLNSAEGMLFKIPSGSVFIAPSNKFGDYVLSLPNHNLGLLAASGGGLVVGEADGNTWFPGFRVIDYSLAQSLDVGTILTSDVVGALHYRVDAYQLSVNHRFSVAHRHAQVSVSPWQRQAAAIRVMTLNCFNLDPKIENAELVVNPRTDIDDDYGDGRFTSLAKAIVVNAKAPEIVALQEIQDSDGAELTDVTEAHDTYQLLLQAITQLSDVPYKWVDHEPELNADGGQPGGNIRNGFLYRTDLVRLVPHSVRRLGVDSPAFIDSRKPVVAEFELLDGGQTMSVFNVHFASKRHQESVFSPHNPGSDPKLVTRIEQAEIVLAEMERLAKQDAHYYVTGDFNDGEHSQTLTTLCAKGAQNLVFQLSPEDRYDYNHRGKLQVLMHGIVSSSLLEVGLPEYAILHGNELLGVTPGEDTDKASDHAYVIARFRFKQ